MDFPKRYTPTEVEPRMRRLWDETGIYKFNPDDPRPIFSVDTPPPYVSSDHLHVGHAMSYSQAEFIVRYKRMMGFSIFYPMGFDDNGLPTERFVEKKHKINKSKISREDFVKLCLEETKSGAKVYRNLWEALGISVDWDLTYSTIDPRSVRTSQMSFCELHKHNRIQRRDEPITWCYKCGTSVAQAEIETTQLDSQLNDIAFTGPDGEELIISTTRPELIPACVSVYVNPDDERYRNLIGKKARIPLFDYEVEIRSHPDVAVDFGTGLMMVCSWGDTEDVKKWKEHKLDTRAIFNKWGKLNELAGPYENMTTANARKAILDDLKKLGLVKKQENISHMVGVHDRCGTPIEFNHSPQWFISLLDKKDEYLRRGEEIDWHPGHFISRYSDWVEGLKWDWCISRQRFYGVPFPVWYCDKCGEPRIAAHSELPVDPMMKSPPEGTTCTCGHTVFIPEKDVMDTWMTSSLTPLINAKWAFDENLMKRIYPMSIRVQAFEIIRTWLFYTVAKSHHHTDSLPWTDVMISGWGLDDRGRKMSKSSGNHVPPEPVIVKYGADALRYWSAKATLGNDLRYHERDVANGKRLMTKLWNAGKFVAMQLFDENDERRTLTPGVPTTIDRWVRSRLQQVIAEAGSYMERYEYSHAVEITERFFFTEFCDNYIEIVKERFWNPDNFEADVVEAGRWTLREVCENVVKLFAPFIPYITEELYQIVFREKDSPVSVHVTQWPKADLDSVDEQAVESGRLLIAVLTGARRWKTDQKVNQNHPLKLLRMCAPENLLDKLRALNDDLRAAAHADVVEFGGDGDVETEVAEIKLALELGEKRQK